MLPGPSVRWPQPRGGGRRPGVPEFQPSLGWIRQWWHWLIRRHIEHDNTYLLGGYETVANLDSRLDGLLLRQRDGSITDEESDELRYALDIRDVVTREAAFQRTSGLFTITMILVVLGSFAVALGLYGYIYATSRDRVDNLGKPFRPHLTAEVTTASRPLLHATVTSRGVNRQRGVSVDVSGKAPGGKRVALYQSYIGPNGDGTVDHAFDVPLELGRFKFVVLTANVGHRRVTCAGTIVKAGDTASSASKVKRATEYACTRIRLPHVTRRPQLAASWVTTDPETQILQFKAETGSLGPASQLQVAVIVSNSAPRAIYSSIVGPDSRGVLSVSSTVTIPPDDSIVCIVAQASNRPPRKVLDEFTGAAEGSCPPAHAVANAVLRLAVPGR